MKQWLLLIFDVPDRLGGLLARLDFKRTKKNPATWWRIFDPAAEGTRESAEAARQKLLAAGLSGKWREIDDKAKPAPEVVSAIRLKNARVAAKRPQRQKELARQRQQTAKRDAADAIARHARELVVSRKPF